MKVELTESESNCNQLVLGGLVPLSTSDYPACLSAVLFCQGCPWRCRYCHNPHLQPRINTEIQFSDVLNFLRQRRGFLDAVVFSGGEPTYQEGILAAMKKVHELDFKIGMHTAAPSLEVLNRLLPYLDWVGLDIKALPDDYSKVTGVSGSGLAPFDALELLLDAGIDHEVRTTVHSLLMDDSDLLMLAEKLQSMGVKKYAMQVFRKRGCQDEELNSVLVQQNLNLIDKLRSMFPSFTLRSY